MRNTDGLRQRLPRIVADEPVASACDGLVRRVYRADARGAEDIDGVRTRLSDLAVPVIEGTASLERPQRPPVRLRLPALALKYFLHALPAVWAERMPETDLELRVAQQIRS